MWQDILLRRQSASPEHMGGTKASQLAAQPMPATSIHLASCDPILICNSILPWATRPSISRWDICCAGWFRGAALSQVDMVPSSQVRPDRVERTDSFKLQRPPWGPRRNNGTNSTIHFTTDLDRLRALPKHRSDLHPRVTTRRNASTRSVSVRYTRVHSRIRTTSPPLALVII